MKTHAMIVACVSAILVGAVAEAQTPTLQASTRQLVMPFENVKGDPGTYWLREASPIILADDLVALGVPVIERGDRVRAFDRLRVPAVAALSHATVIRLGQVVGAGQVIVGVFELMGNEIIIRVRAIRLDTGRMAPEILERGPLGSLFTVYARAARRLAPDSSVTLEQMERSHPPLPAFEQYVKGLVAEASSTKLSFLKRALELYPGLHQARLALWDVYATQDDHQAALAAVLSVPAGDRLFRQAQFRAAVSLLRIGMYGEAHATLTELNRRMPDAALLNNLGVVQLRRPAGAPGGTAVDYFKQAAQLDAGDPDLFFNLGYAFWLQRDVASAISSLREAVRRNPADHEAHYVLGVALQASGKAAEGAREKELAKQLSSVFRDWEAKQPRAESVPRGLERLKTEIDVPASMRMESVIVAVEQRDQRLQSQFHLDTGRRLYQADRDAEAVAELRRAVYLSPYERDAHLLLGRIYLRSGRIQDAIDELKISLWIGDTVATRLALAEAYVAGRENAAAREELQRVLKRDPGNGEARRMLDRLPPR